MQYWAENDTKWLKISQKQLLLADHDRKISLKVLKVDIYHSGQVFQVILRKIEQKGQSGQISTVHQKLVTF